MVSFKAAQIFQSERTGGTIYIRKVYIKSVIIGWSDRGHPIESRKERLDKLDGIINRLEYKEVSG